ncbi:MaoC/PaaZ C-terminal domain-containing protein [Falsiroseomonas sp. CW058]|uniref:MaoC family dehydratase n=1 Tax=Falsiroseomonas sp. CW058 TaxID=3388664 RepID=UPI003D31494E
MTLDARRLMTLAIPARNPAWSGRETMLYALAVGLGAAEDDLPFVFEDGLRVVPSMATALAFDDSWLDAGGIDLRRVVHGALDLDFAAPLPASGEAAVASRIVGLGDKGAGRGGLVFQESVVSLGGAPASTVRSTIFVRGAGGFGGGAGTQFETAPLPARAPDEVAEVATAANQALLFRLLGDRNPLHADPAVARAAGFARPILHGACTFGIACAEVLRRFCGRDPARLARFAARFAGPLHPGETLRFDFWRDGPRLGFRAAAAGRNAPVLDNGFAVLVP